MADEDLARDRDSRRVKDELTWALQDLAANLIRVVRGAGKPHLLRDYAVAFLNAIEDYKEVTGSSPDPDLLAKILSIERDTAILRKFGDDTLLRHNLQRDIVRGSLQIAASRLIRQLAQEQSGDTELTQAINFLHLHRDKLVQARPASEAAAAEPRKTPNRRGSKTSARKSEIPFSP